MKKILVLFGGCSPEYAVSLQSAYSVLRHMDRERYRPIPVGITQAGDWFLYTGKWEAILAGTWQERHCLPAAVSPNRRDHGLLVWRRGGMEIIPLDGAFPVLHGKNGEDGTVQGLLELAGIPVVGCGILASALCMDKMRAHQLVQAAGVEIPRSLVFDRKTSEQERMDGAASLGYPLFVKPLRAGSSFGISKVMSSDQLQGAWKSALKYDETMILEEAVPGFEVGCAVLGNKTLTIGEVDEVELSHGFFDYTEKYSLRTSAIHVPARVTKEQAALVKAAAATVYRALGCRGFARVDFFLTPSGNLVFNEVNTIPGLTAHSRFPKMLEAAGIPLEDAVTQAIEEALEP